ncbi:hypothetical protein ACHAPJ_008346 [Fusarium lateritium]
MPSITYATVPPQIYSNTIIIGACGVVTDKTPGTHNDGWFLLDMFCRYAEAGDLGLKQYWVSATPIKDCDIRFPAWDPENRILREHRAEEIASYSKSPTSEIIHTVLEQITDASRLARGMNPPSQIILLLFGHGSPSLGCYMDYDKSIIDPEAILTPTKILEAMDPEAHITLVMNPYTDSAWSTCRNNLERMLADGGTYNTAGVPGSIPHRLSAQWDTPQSTPQFARRTQRVLARMLRNTCPRDSGSSFTTESLFEDLSAAWVNVADWSVLNQEPFLAAMMQYRLHLSAFSDELVTRFRLIRPFGQTCLSWDMDRWPKKRPELLGDPNEYFDALGEMTEQEVRMKNSGFARCTLYWKAAFRETYGHCWSEPNTQRFMSRLYERILHAYLQGELKINTTMVKLLPNTWFSNSGAIGSVQILQDDDSAYEAGDELTEIESEKDDGYVLSDDDD